jgi:hypothetical protein
MIANLYYVSECFMTIIMSSGIICQSPHFNTRHYVSMCCVPMWEQTAWQGVCKLYIERGYIVYTAEQTEVLTTVQRK